MILQKIMISASEKTAKRLEEKLRHRFDVMAAFVDNPVECKISAKVRNKWVTICRFAADEDLKHILTMFEVNLEIKMRYT